MDGTKLAQSPSMGRFLVVDDDRSTVRAMATLLEQDGHEVVAMTSGKEALEALRSGSAFDAVVTDFQMPGVDGGTVTRQARKSLPHACIVVTQRGHADEPGLREAGACIVLEKPIAYDALQRIIRACRAGGEPGDPSCLCRARERQSAVERNDDLRPG
jgi:CheY-like chemotaxis protein